MKPILKILRGITLLLLFAVIPQTLPALEIGLSINDVTITEGDSGTSNMTFTVSASASVGANTPFAYTITPGTATNPADYTGSSGTGTIANGSSNATFTVPIVGDLIEEGTKTFTVTITSGAAVIYDGTGVGTILDNDTRSIAINDMSITEGDSGTSNVTMTVTLTGNTASVALPFTITTGGGTATAGMDYTAQSNVAYSIAAGTSSKTFTIPIVGDTIVEPSETFNVTLVSSLSGLVGDGTGVVTINDNDKYTLTLSPTTLSTAEGNSGTTNATYTVTLSESPTANVTVNYATANGSATAGSDYTATSGTLTFNAGQTSKTINVPILGDTSAEPNETYTLSLSSPSANAQLGTSSATGTITNDDSGTLSISQSGTSVSEGGGTKTYTVTLSTTPTSNVTVNYATANGTATAGSDYTAKSGTLTFASGTSTLSQNFTVSITDDTVQESDETYSVSLSSPANATISTSSVTTTITDNDGRTLSISPTTHSTAEGNSGNTDATYTVTLSGTPLNTVTVNYATANGSATAGSDYTARSGTLTFAAGTTTLTQTISVPIIGDTTPEPNETFTVTLSSASGATLSANKTATETITNDDTPTLSFVNLTPSRTEANANLAFTVTLSAAQSTNVTVQYRTYDVTAQSAVNTATNPRDFTAIGSTTLTFTPGQTSKTINVGIRDDSVDELDETFTLKLSSAVGATISGGDTATGTIVDNDSVSLSFTQLSVSTVEGNSGTTNAVYSVKLSKTPASNVTVNYATANGTATIANNDYTATSGTLTFTAGTTTLTQTISVPIKGDTAVEPNETYTLTLSSPVNATISGGATATGTIVNDDTSISINDITILEPPCFDTTANLTVTLAQAVNYNVTVGYSTGGGTATAGASADYNSASGSITIPAGSTTGTISVTIHPDSLVESSETFNVTITNGAGITITDNVGVVTITDNQNTAVSYFNDSSVVEGDVGQVNMPFTVTLCKVATANTTINYRTHDSSAVDGGTALGQNDYDGTSSGSVTIPAGSLSGTFNIPVNGDLVDEGMWSEGFVVELFNWPSNVTITDQWAWGQIIDDDSRNISINDVAVSEGNSGTTATSLNITMSQSAGTPVTVYYSTRNGTATTADSDYVSASGSVTFAVGETSKTVPLTVNGDTKVEGNEYFDVNISTLSGVTISDNTGRVTINDDDNRTLTLGGTNSYTEGNVNRDINLTVTLDSASPIDRTITYSTANGSATSGQDFIGVTNQTVIIPANTTTVNLPITIIGNLVYESLSETFNVSITSSDGFALSGSPRTITIIDDDGRLSVNDRSVTEGDSGTKDMTFTVSLNRAMTTDVNVSYTTSDNTATVADNDYNATSGVLTFTVGQTSKTFVVKINGDTKYEPTETFNVTIANTQGVTVHDATGVGTITDDDARTVTINSPSYPETETNTSRNFTVTLSASRLEDTNLTFATSNATATEGSDYVATSGTLTIPAGTTSKTLPVTIIGDYVNEPNESFSMTLSTSEAGITIPSAGVMTITNDDGNLSIIPTVSRDETNTSSFSMPFTVTLSQVMGSPVTVAYTTMDGNATSSGANKDFEAAMGTLTFAAGETSKTINVTIYGDIIYEGTEYFDLNISNTQGVNVTASTSRGYIVEDDARTISIINSSANEGDTGVIESYITVSLSLVSGSDANVSYVLSGDTATSGIDFNATSGNVTILAGSTTASIPIQHYGDLAFEPNETISVIISTTTPGFTVTNPNGTFTLVNDDGVLRIDDATILEGNTSTTTSGTVNVNLSRTSTVDINVSYTLVAGTATADLDYNATGGTITIPAGATSAAIPLTILGDALIEGDEYFTVNITNDQGVTIDDPNGNITIREDDLDAMEIFDNQREFSLRFGKNIYGNYTSTGAPIMCALNAAKTACDWNYNGSLASADTQFLNDASMTRNSSSADLNISMESGDKVLWAGLYWQGHIESDNAEDLDNNTSGWNTVSFKTPDGTTYTKTANLADNHQTNYYAFQAATSATYDGFRFFYQGFADVTAEVNASLSVNTGRTFSVGEMTASTGPDRLMNDPALDGGSGFGRVGHFGGWSLIVVYEKGDKTNPDDLRNVSIFDGYKYLVANTVETVKSIDINVNGFRTPNSVSLGDPIDSKLLYFGGGSEKSMIGDEMNISNKSGVFSTVFDGKNPANNPFNDTVTNLGNDINPLRIYNPGIDLDTIQVGEWLETNQTSTKIRLSAVYTSGSDQAFAGAIGFSTQLYQPQLCYDFTYRQNSVYMKNTVGERDLPMINGYVTTSPITAGIYLKNTDSDFAIEGLSLFTDMNGSKISYIEDTTKATKANASVLKPVTEASSCSSYETGTSSDPACRSATAEGAGSKNLRVGLGTNATGHTKDNAGYLDSGDFVYTQFQLNPFGLSGDVNESIGLKINYFIDLGDGEIVYEYTLGKHVKLCPPNPGYYSPTWGMFNVTDRKYSALADATSTLPYNNLRTQVSREPFDVDVALYEKEVNATAYTHRPTVDVETTVLVEIIDGDAFHDVNASCSNPDSNLTRPIFVPLTITPSDMTDPVETQPASYYNFAVKNGAFRVWYFVESNNTLIQGWTANTSDTTKLELTQINGLYKPAVHTACAVQCGVDTSPTCFDCIRDNYAKALCSRDNFSVRPESYDVRIFDVNKSLSYNSYDKNETRVDLSDMYGYIPTDAGTPNSVTERMNLAAGYTYRFDINATGHNEDELAKVPGYTRYFRGPNSDYNSTMMWDPRSGQVTTGCNDTLSRDLAFNIIEGSMLNQEQNHTQVGDYTLQLIDQTWTEQDFDDNLTQHHTLSNGFEPNAIDCIEGSNNTIDGTDVSKNGCVISSSHNNGAHTYKNHTLTFKPAKFDLSTFTYGLGKNAAGIGLGGEGFVYNANLNNDNDMNMSVRLKGSIIAKGDNDGALSNFVKECYAVDLNLTIEHNASTANRFVGRMHVEESNGTQIFDSLEYDAATTQPPLTIDETYFSKTSNGQARTTVRLNFDRNVTTFLAPQSVHYGDINTTCTELSDCNMSAMSALTPNTAEGTDEMDFNITHVYGRVKPNDIRVMGSIPFDATARYEVYQTPTLLGTGLRVDPSDNNWYINALHDESNHGDASITVIYPMDTNASLPESFVYSMGVETYHFDAFGSRKGRTAHIDTEGWLWYGPTALDYVDPIDPTSVADNTAKCLTHPCFKILFGKTIGNTGSAKTESEEDKGNKESSSANGEWKSTSEYAPAIQ